MARRKDGTVMLSAAKHLDAQRDRPFAALRVTVEEPISSSVLFFETALSRSAPIYRPFVDFPLSR